MRYLLDTHIILWVESGSSRLSTKLKSIIEDNTNECFVSIASLWEMTIKIALKKLLIDVDFKNFLEYLAENNFKILEINTIHLNTLLTLPLHHKDPFDRLLIAQAITENLTLISADQHFQSYPVHLLS